MKSKLVKIIIAVLVIGAIICGVIFIPKILKKDKPKENTFSQLINDSSEAEDNEEMSIVSDAFLKNISYDIKEANEDKQTADIEVSVPVLGDTYNTIVEQVVNENPDLAYEELLELTKEELADSLNNGDFETKTETLTVPYQEIDGEMQIIPNDAFFDFVSEELYEMYFDMLVESAGGVENDEN